MEEALVRRGIEAGAKITLNNYFQVDYRVPAVLPLVSILIPTACRSGLVERCLAKLLKATTYPHFEVLLLVNEAAPRNLFESLATDARVRVVSYPDRPFNYSWINNWGVGQARGTVLCFMNDDTEIIRCDWLQQMVARLAVDGVGAVGPMLYFPSNTIQSAGVILGIGGVANHAHRFAPRHAAGYFGRAALEQDYSCITAACAVVSRQAFEEVGGFDEQFAVAFNDVYFCIRLTQAGWRNVWTGCVELYHHESATVGSHQSPERARQFREEEQLMLRKWGAVLASDKNYNPNLSLAPGHTFKLAFPPRVDWRASIASALVRHEAACEPR